MATELVVEFPVFILAGYNGGLSNLDETLDDNILYLLGRYFYENEISFKVNAFDIVAPMPGHNDELVRYEIEIGRGSESHCSERIVAELMDGGYESGCTIRATDGQVLHADLLTADIKLRRQLSREAR